MGAVLRGAVSGAIGTAAMDAVLYARYRRGGGQDGLLDWEFSTNLTRWEDAPAPALMGKRLVEAFTGQPLTARRARLMNNFTHWAYGIAWGSAYGVGAGSLRRPVILLGLPFGASVWASSYVVLPLAKLYKPVWEYDLKTLGKDLSAHLAYGLGTAASFALLATGGALARKANRPVSQPAR